MSARMSHREACGICHAELCAHVIAERHSVTLDREDGVAFQALIERPPRDIPSLRALLGFPDPDTFTDGAGI